MTTQTEPQTATTTTCPPWCGWETGRCDGFHMSRPTYTPTADQAETLDVSLNRDDTDSPGPTQVAVVVSADATGTAAADLTPAQVVELMTLLRERALTAAGPDGIPVPVEQVRLGDQIRVGDQWETVETLMVDGWCCGQPPMPGHRWAVYVGTNAIDDDNDAHQYGHGDLVQVRAVQP